MGGRQRTSMFFDLEKKGKEKEKGKEKKGKKR